MAASLSACGGGDGPDTHSTFDGPVSVAEAVGNYTTGCVKREVNGSEYKIITATFANSFNGSGKAVVHYQSFGTDSKCKAESLAFDVTADFDVSPVVATKNITNASVQNPLTGVASVAEATLRGLTLSRGTFTGAFPTMGLTTKVGYLVSQSNLRFLAGTREADGLARHISTIVLKKI